MSKPSVSSVVLSVLCAIAIGFVPAMAQAPAPAAPVTEAVAPAKAPAPAVPGKATVATPAATAVAMPGSALVPVLSKFSLTLYGYVKLDASYDSSRVSAGDLAFYVMPKTAGEKDDEFNFTARESRIGIEIKSPEYGDTKVSGKIEVDFYGNAGSANTPVPRLRLGFVDVAHNDWLVRAGQDWETFITAIPKIDNFSYMADAGALGLRRPQLRVQKDFKVSADSKFVAKIAAARTIGQDIDGGGQDDGADAPFPTAQYNLTFESKLFADKTAKFGVSGHWGRETIDTVISNKVVSNDDKNYDSWSVIGSVVLPLCEYMAIQGSIWKGANLDTYYGGIGQGVNAKLDTSIGAVGGWGELMFDITKNLNWNIGYGIDDPDDGDLNDKDRSKNQILFSNVYYKLLPPVTLVFEYTYMKTDYKASENESDNRFQGSVVYNF